MLSDFEAISWEYVVHCEDKKGQKLILKSIGKFSTPYEAVTFISENGRDWQFFGNFEVCDKSKTARSSFLDMWKKNINKRGN